MISNGVSSGLSGSASVSESMSAFDSESGAESVIVSISSVPVYSSFVLCSQVNSALKDTVVVFFP